MTGEVEGAFPSPPRAGAILLVAVGLLSIGLVTVASATASLDRPLLVWPIWTTTLRAADDFRGKWGVRDAAHRLAGPTAARLGAGVSICVHCVLFSCRVGFGCRDGSRAYGSAPGLAALDRAERVRWRP